MYYREREGYYTYDQVVEALRYVNADPDLGDERGYSHNQYVNHLERVIRKMEQYHMDIIPARKVLIYDSWYEAIVETYKIIPIPFKTTPEKLGYPHTPPKISIDFRMRKCCANCKISMILLNRTACYPGMVNTHRKQIWITIRR
jgi:hypothetical protein